MDIFGIDPSTVRTAVSAQLLFGALFFYLSMRMLPGYRMLPLWATANLLTFCSLVLEAVGTGPVNAVAKLVGGVLMVSGGALLWGAIRYNYNLAINWRAGLAVWLGIVVGIGLPLWWFTHDRLVYTVFYHVLCGLVLIAALRDYARCQSGAWTVQSGLLVTVMASWGLFSIAVGLLRITHFLFYPMEDLVQMTRIPLAAGTTLIIIALNFFGFLLISQKLSQELNQLASTDSLTGVLNRRAFHRQAKAFFASPAQSTFLLLLDLDHFKQINDRFGHAAGDQVLIGFADTVRGLLRRKDLFGRTGGEEFCILLPQANEQEALAIAERIRNGVEAMAFMAEDGKTRIPVTVSIGMAVLRPGDTFDQTAAEADKALYAAKNHGRNRVVRAECAPPRPLAGAMAAPMSVPLPANAEPEDAGAPAPKAPAPKAPAKKVSATEAY